MRVRWTRAAGNDLQEIARYIRQDNPEAARRVVRAILEGVTQLRTLPKIGRPAEKRNTRELVISRYPAYVVVYRVDHDMIHVLRIWHGAQDWR